MGPSTRLEKKLELVNHGNRACWSPYCRDGSSAKLDQLSKPSWWIDMQNCAAINFCIVDMNDTNINQYGNSILHINNCNDEQKEKNAGEEDLQSTGAEIDMHNSNSGVEITDGMKFAIAGGILLLLLLIALNFSSVKKLEKTLKEIKQEIKQKNKQKKSIASNRQEIFG